MTPTLPPTVARFHASNCNCRTVSVGSTRFRPIPRAASPASQISMKAAYALASISRPAICSRSTRRTWPAMTSAIINPGEAEERANTSSAVSPKA